MTAGPVLLVRQFHHGAILVNAKAGLRSPQDLEGKRVGVNRGYGHDRRGAAVVRCSKKKRTISRLASGPRCSVYDPAALPPDHAWPPP